MSNPENMNDDAVSPPPDQKPAKPIDEEPGDNIGNLKKTDREQFADDDIGNRRAPNEERFVDDNIGNRSDGRERDGRGDRGDRGPRGGGGGGGGGRSGGRGRRRGRRRPRQSEGRGGEGGGRGSSRPAPAEAPVRYVLKSDPEEKRAAAEQVCGEIVKLCQREAEVSAELVDEAGQPKVVVLVNEKGDDVPLFTRNSAALSALNFLTNKVVNRFPDDRIRLVVHVHSSGGPPQAHGGGDREPRPSDGPTEEMARRLAEHAVRVKRALSIAPIKPDQRRIVHVTLESNPDVVTMSEGEGSFRKLLVVPRSMLNKDREETEGDAESAEVAPEEAQ